MNRKFHNDCPYRNSLNRLYGKKPKPYIYLHNYSLLPRIQRNYRTPALHLSESQPDSFYPLVSKNHLRYVLRQSSGHTFQYVTNECGAHTIPVLPNHSGYAHRNYVVIVKYLMSKKSSSVHHPPLKHRYSSHYGYDYHYKYGYPNNHLY